MSVSKGFTMHLAMLRFGRGLAFVVAVALGSTSCGGGGGSDSAPPSSGAPPPSAPVGNIVFPSTRSFTESDSLTLLGTGAVAVGDTPLKVNGVDALSSDGFKKWSVRVPLSAGRNELTLTTRGGAVLDRAVVDHDAILGMVGRVTFDPTRDRLLDFGGFIAIDPTTGTRSFVSKPPVFDPNDPFSPLESEVVPSGDRAWVLNLVIRPTIEPPNASWFARITAVDLGTGQRTNLPPLLALRSELADLALDAANDRALLVEAFDLSDRNRVCVLGVNLTTGDVSIVSDFGTPNGIDPFEYPVDIAVDAPRRRALVVTSDGRLLAVDLATGARSVVTVSGPPDLSPPIAVDAARAKAFLGGLTEVDLLTGARRPILDAPRKVNGLAFDARGNRLFAVEDDGVLTSIDMTVRRASTLVQWHFPDARPPPLGFVSHPTLDIQRNRILAMGYSIDENQSRTPSLIAIDLATRETTLVSGSAQPDTGVPLEYGSVAAQSERGRALVTDASRGEVLTVDLATGERTVVSNFFGENIYSALQDIVLDRARNRALISNQKRTTYVDGMPDPFGGADSIIEMDLDTGEGRLFSGPSKPDAESPFSRPGNIALDPARNRLLVEDYDRIIAVDLTTGHRSVFATAPTAFGDIEVDEAGGRILVAGGNGVALDAATGNPTSFPTGGPWFATDPTGRIFTLAGENYVAEQNRITGERVTLSR